jgi:hypothetical protein
LARADVFAIVRAGLHDIATGDFRMNFVRAALIAATTLAIASSALAGEPDGRSGALYDTIVAQDAALFAAFNTCKIDALGVMVSDDLAFFHDQGGLMQGRAAFLESVQKNVCGKFTRELVPGSAEVWPVPGYGAIEIGTHKFIHPDRAREPDGIGKFMILWKQEGERWVMTQTFSYAHMPAPQ